MFDKFNDTARAAILMSKDIAADFGQDHINTSHLLLAVSGAVARKPQWRNTPGISSKAEAVISALGTSPEAIIDQTMPGLEYGAGHTPSHLPFTPNLKQVLEYALRSSMMLGDNHIGPEHLLAGLARAEESTAGKVLGRLNITDIRVQTAIQDSAPAAPPTAARICDVYIPAGKSVFKNGGKIYPDLASAQAAHPGKEIAPFTVPLHDGEFFDVGTTSPRFSSWGKFATYPDAFAAAEGFNKVQGADVKIRIMVPDVQEMRGKDSRGHDVVLGRSIEYARVSVISRLAGTLTYAR